MHKKKSKDLRKSHQFVKKKIVQKKPICSFCQMKLGVTVHIQDALLRKYSSQNLPYYLRIEEHINNEQRNYPQRKQIPREQMIKYYKPAQRRHSFFQIKQIYQLHKQAPRLFMPNILSVLSKRHHRKRLLQYFKIAKVLGLKISSAKTSTFLCSLSKTYQPKERQSFDKILNSISGYEFSEQIEKKLLEALDGKETISYSSRLNPQAQYCSEIKLN